MAHTLEIEYGDDVLLSAGLTQEQFNQEARFLLAAKLFELGKLSSGQAARLCGKERVDFLLSLPQIGCRSAISAQKMQTPRWNF
jgi:predicted HTH domain antitoxin